MTTDEARQAERAAIVRWLRTAGIEHILCDRYKLADAIQAGAHLVPPKDDESNDNGDGDDV